MIHVMQSSLNQITEIFNGRKSAIGLSDYSVGEIFDHGGMSNIYRIIDASGNTDYVLRVSEEHKSSYSNNIFNVREIEILRELKKNSQPHVVQYLDAFVVDIPGQPRYYCAVMKFLCTLKQYRVKGDGVEIAVRLGCDFLPLLQSFMEKEILHRDIKPENIFYDGDFRNETGFLLGDFGIAKRDTDTSVTPTGTETTMAPEVRGLDRSLGRDRTYSDMYSLGLVMYRYLNQGIYPSNRERIDKMPPDKKPFPEPRYGSKRLKELVIKATSYDPKDRFDSPQAMLRELQQCDEYREYCQWTSAESDITVSGSVYTSEKMESLLRELEEKEKECAAFRAEIEQLEQEAEERENKLKSQIVVQQAEIKRLEQEAEEQESELKSQIVVQQTEIKQLEQEAEERESELKSRVAVQQLEIKRLERKHSGCERKLKARIVDQQKEIERLKLQAVDRESELQSQIVAQQAEADQQKLQAAKRESELQSEINMLKLKVALFGDDQAYDGEEAHDGEEAEAHGIEEAEAHDGEEAEAHGIEEAEAHGIEEAEAHGIEEAETYDDNETIDFRYEESDYPKKSVKLKSEKETVSVGDHITLGNYMQGANGEIQPIEWRVLDVKDGKALVISEKMLDYLPYNQSYKNVTWENSTLRQWMNEKFFNSAFWSDEKRKIVTVTNYNPMNPEYGTAGGRTTRDIIFALSIDELKKYFSSDNDRIARTTDYAHSKEYDNEDRAGWWWLRSPGFNSYRAVAVDENGSVSFSGIFTYGSKIAVRPAFWLELG